MNVPMVTIGDICDLAYGDGLIETKRKGGAIPVYGSNGVIGFHDQSLTKGETLIIGRKGSIGEIHYSKVPCWPIDTTYYVETTKLPCDLTWLYYVLISIDLTRLNKSAAVPGLNREDVYEIKISFPSIKDQKRIAAILQKVDRVRRLRRYARQLSDGYLQSVFLEMFGDKKNHEWQKVNFYTICKKITDGTHDTPQRVPSGIPFITSKNIRSFEIDLSILEFVTPEVHDQIKKRCFPKIGDILFTNIGANIGNAVVNSLPFEFSLKNVALIQPNPHLVDSYYLESLLNNPEFRNNLISVSSSGGVQPFISLDVLRNAIIKIPPYDLQQKYHQIAAKFIKNKKILFEAERQAEQLFQSLLHQAFEEQDR